MDERTCGWCGCDISHKRSNAKYCSTQHKKNAGSKRHRERNPGYYKQYVGSPTRTAWAAENREVLRAKARARRAGWDAERATQERDAVKAWWAANKQKHYEYNARRRARTRSASQTVGVSERDWQRLVRRYDHRCAYCGARPEKLHKDHVVPIIRGGRHAIGNILPCCGPCNSSKCARLLSDWRYRR